jgi:hypothetical protein
MSSIPVISTYGVPEREVDALIEAFLGSPVQPVRWMVFGTEASLLWALDSHWGKIVDLVVVLMPNTEIEMVDVAISVMASEQVELGATVWLHGAELPIDPPSGFRAALRVPLGGARQALNLVLTLPQ